VIITTREQRRQLARDNLKMPTHMIVMPPEQWQPQNTDPKRRQVWRSRDFLAQAFQEHAAIRVSVNRTSVDPIKQRWDENISWDDLMAIKNQIGYGERWAYECFPPDMKVVNVAAMRHLWIPDAAPMFGWNR
jgi:hypothetical protein